MKKICSRPPLRRIRTIISRLRQGRYPNCTQLARELEVQRRTVLRDIDYLRDTLNVPVAYDPHHYGYHLTGHTNTSELAPPTINQSELLALLLAERALDEFTGTPFEPQLRSAIQKLTETLADTAPETLTLDTAIRTDSTAASATEVQGMTLETAGTKCSPSPLNGERAGVRGESTYRSNSPKPIDPTNLATHITFRDIGQNQPSLLVFQTITDALNQRREITFRYHKPLATRSTTRQARPYHLACIRRQWYLLAHDTNRAALRTFALTRMKNVSLTDTPYTIPADFSASTYLAGSFGIHSPTGDYHAKIRFTGLAAQLVRERQWHHSQKIIPKPDGAIELHLHLTSLEEIAPWILSWGPEAEVLEPIELRLSIFKKNMKLFTKLEPYIANQRGAIPSPEYASKLATQKTRNINS